MALLVGQDAPLSFNPKTRATYSANVWDFYKPDHTVEYPTVDGALSQTCYYKALEDTYVRFSQKMEKNNTYGKGIFDAETPDFWVFHAPYNKLVQKSYGRLCFMDARRRHTAGDKTEESEEPSPLQDWLEKPVEETYHDKVLDKALKSISAQPFQQRFMDSNAASKKVGNTYTASVFLGLASLLDRAGRNGELCPGKSIGLFSYGSGALATMYSLAV